LSADGIPAWDRLELIDMHSIGSLQHHQLQKNDVMLVLRGSHRAMQVTSGVLGASQYEKPLPIVASSAWAVITPDPKRLNSSFLAWELGLPRTRSMLERSKKGSVLQFIPIAAVADLKIHIPSMERQEWLGRAAAAIDRIEALEAERTRLIRSCLAASTERIDH
jgi:restriction endonuclease S subunit